MNKLGLASLFLAVGALVGCGGGGGGDSDTVSYTGESSPVAITQDNATPLAEASVEASYETVQSYSAESASSVAVVVDTYSNSDVKSKINEVSLMLLKNIRGDQFPAGVVYTADQLNTDPSFYSEYHFCGGSITVSDSLMEAGDTGGSGSITYNNLCIAAFDGTNNAYVNGSVSISWTTTSMKYTYSNLTVTVGDTVASLNGEISCTEDASTGNLECTTTYYYAGSDGQTYKVADVYVSGDDTWGWTVNATFYHPDYGYVTMVATGLKFECANGRPSAGSITLTDSAGSEVYINFTGCDTYIATYTNSSGTTDLTIW